MTTVINVHESTTTVADGSDILINSRNNFISRNNNLVTVSGNNNLATVDSC